MIIIQYTGSSDWSDSFQYLFNELRGDLIFRDGKRRCELSSVVCDKDYNSVVCDQDYKMVTK